MFCVDDEDMKVKVNVSNWLVRGGELEWVGGWVAGGGGGGVK